MRYSIFGVIAIFLLVIGISFFNWNKNSTKKDAIIAQQNTYSPALISKPTSSPVAIEDLEKIDVHGYSTFKNPESDVNFEYSNYFILDPMGQNQNNPPNYILGANFRTPYVTKAYTEDQNLDFEYLKDNTMSISFRIEKYTESSLLAQITKSFSDDENSFNSRDNLKKYLKESDLPKKNSYVYEGVFGDGGPTKFYFFTHKDKFYVYALTGGFNSGQQYSSQAEKVFDKLVSSTQFN